MPRAKYRVTDSDYTHVRFYLSNKLRNSEVEFAKEIAPGDARDEYFEMIHAGERKGRAQRLNAWCEKYLSCTEWRKLKAAVRKRRERWERYNEVKTITVSASAHELLAGIAERDKVTFSEVLEHVLLKAANSSRRIPAKRLSRKAR